MIRCPPRAGPAALLGWLDHKHLVQEVLSPMVAQGMLAYTVPSMEKRPDQRNTARATKVWNHALVLRDRGIG